MKTTEFTKVMKSSNGFLHLTLNLVFLLGCVYAVIRLAMAEFYGWAILLASVGFLVWLFHLVGLKLVSPNVSLVLTLFGKYDGTIKQNGFFWINPFYGVKKLSLRARNMDVAPIKVNDKTGNPIMIGMVVVWKINDTYKACFEIDPDTVATGNANAAVQTASSNLKSFESFVKVQSDAALRQVAGFYPYDHLDSSDTEVTLRSGGEEINDRLESQLRERLMIAGIEVVEARINYLAYASEIASVMLRRQQADAIIAAREKIVEGAVSMVEMALDRLEQRDVVKLDEDKKASMVSNLLVVLCADEAASPVVNTGSLY